MAKGKHAALSATRRYEAAVEHIDRLTNEMVDAKARARQHEAAAEQLPGVLAELERVRAQAEAGTSDEVERVRREAAEHMADADAVVDRVLAILSRTIKAAEGLALRVEAGEEIDGAKVIHREDADWLHALGRSDVYAPIRDVNNRAVRRARRFRRTSYDLGECNTQDNRRTMGDNIDRRRGKEHSPLGD